MEEADKWWLVQVNGHCDSGFILFITDIVKKKKRKENGERKKKKIDDMSSKVSLLKEQK